MGLTREQQHEVKKAFLEQVSKDIEYKGLNEEELKEKIRWLHQRICKLEADKYDLEKRHERQQYDVSKLLNFKSLLKQNFYKNLNAKKIYFLFLFGRSWCLAYDRVASLQLKELNERQRQVFRNNALKKGIDPTDDILSSRYPVSI